VEARSTCEECGEYGHVHKDCLEEAKVLDYMRKGDLPNFRCGQGRPQFNASSSIPNSVPLRIQLKDFMDEQAKINKDTITKFKAIDKVLENIDSKVTEVGSSNHQVLNMMKMLETQVGQLVGHLTSNEGKLPRQPKGPESAIANGLGKQKDPGCQTIPCSVGSFKFEKALCDLGGSVSVMPRDVFEKLRLPLEPTGMCLELGDNSIHYPLGIAEDVLVKVRHHFIPIDFVVLEMGEREKPPLIHGRPFHKTVGATIDVGKGEIMFDINGERSSFKFRSRLEVCNMIEVKYVPPHRRVVMEKPRKKEELKKKEELEKKNVKKIKEVVASVKTKEQKPPVKTKKMTKPGNKPVTKMVQKWVIKIATPAKSVVPK
jgi:hypothetical protein